ENNDFHEIARAHEGNKLSRLRIGYNRYHSWATVPDPISGLYYLAENSLLNKAGAEVYNLTFTSATPCYYSQQVSNITGISYLSDYKRAASIKLTGTYSTNSRQLVDG